MKEILQIIEIKLGVKLSQVDLTPLSLLLREINVTDKIKSNIKRILEALPLNFNFPNDSTALILYLEIIIKCGCFSNYLTDILVRNPEYLTWLVTNANLNENYDKKYYLAELNHLLNLYKTTDKKINSIIRFKRREMLRIGVKDLLKISSLEDIIKEYSSLTDAIIQAVLELSIQLNIQKYNLTQYTPSYCMIALGKLGGIELNYSSDVDLIFIYGKEKNLKKGLSTNEFFTGVLNYFIEFCTKQRETGTLFRIDFRLRPDGKFSPLCRDLYSYLLYYETKGQFWERQMLLKARLLCGDAKLYTKFRERINHFIYQKLIFSSPKDFIKTLRDFTVQESLIGNNIKHFKGGIRDIEFSIQALQLLNASNYPSLKTGNTLQALQELLKCGLMSYSDFEILKNAYILYRKIENYLQLMDDRQTHFIPSDYDSLKNLSTYLDYKSVDKLIEDINYYRKNVNKFYDSVFGIETKKNDRWSKIEFQNFDLAQSALSQLKTPTRKLLQPSYSYNYSKTFEEISDTLFLYLKYSKFPDRILANFYNLVLNLNFSKSFYEMIRDKKIFKAILQMCEFSDSLINQLCFDKFYQDFLLTGKLFANINNAIQFIKYDLNELKLLEFYLKFNFLLKRLSAEKISRAICDFFDKAIRKIFDNQKNRHNLEDEILIIGMGSFGNYEMNFYSDIDLVFIYKKSTDEVNDKIQFFFRDFMNEIRDVFRNKEHFSIDARLRPEGKSSQLVWEFEEFVNYVNHRMRIWEFQAYTKSRLVIGSKKLYRNLINTLSKKLSTFTTAIVVEEIQKNLKKIKQQSILPAEKTLNLKLAEGGIIDLQFLIQFLIIQNSFRQFKIKYLPNVLRKEICKHSKIKEDDIKLLSNIYSFLINLVFFSQIAINRKNPIIGGSEIEEYLVKKFFRIPISTNLVHDINFKLNINSRIIKKIYDCY